MAQCIMTPTAASWAAAEVRVPRLAQWVRESGTARAAAWIQFLDWELPHAASGDIKKKKERERQVNLIPGTLTPMELQVVCQLKRHLCFSQVPPSWAWGEGCVQALLEPSVQSAQAQRPAHQSVGSAVPRAATLGKCPNLSMPRFLNL